MKKLLLLLLPLFFVLSAQTQYVQTMSYDHYWFRGQLTIGKTGKTQADASAWLDLGDNNTTKGLLLPRIANTSAITSPAKGLIVYNNADNTLYYRTASSWVQLGTGGGGGGAWGSITGTLSDQTDLQAELDGKQDVIGLGGTSQYFRGDLSLATLDKAAVGLGNVLNVTQEPAITGGTTSEYWRGDKTFQTLNKTAVGLSNVDNTSDLGKPISTLTQAALDLKEGVIIAGTTTQYWRGDKTWQEFPETDLINIGNLDTLAVEVDATTIGFKSIAVVAGDNVVITPTITDSTISYEVDATGGGGVTLSAIGSTPNANGATLTGAALNLEPASASFGGVVTTGTQAFNGTKTFERSAAANFDPIITIEEKGSSELAQLQLKTPTRRFTLMAGGSGSAIGQKFLIQDGTSSTDRYTIDANGHHGVNLSTSTAWLHLAAGTATANTAPLKFTSGTALTTPEDGALEYHSSHLYFTIGSTRYQLDQQGGGASAVGGTGAVQFANSTAFDGDNTVFVWDNTNDRLGVGIASPQHKLDVFKSIAANYTMPVRIRDGQSDAYAGVLLQAGSGEQWSFFSAGESETAFGMASDFGIFNVTDNAMRFIVRDNGNIVIPDLAGTGTRLVTASSTGLLDDIANGTDGQELRMVSGTPTWSNPIAYATYSLLADKTFAVSAVAEVITLDTENLENGITHTGSSEEITFPSAGIYTINANYHVFSSATDVVKVCIQKWDGDSWENVPNSSTLTKVALSNTTYGGSLSYQLSLAANDKIRFVATATTTGAILNYIIAADEVAEVPAFTVSIARL
jgi:hypothetical protein